MRTTSPAIAFLRRRAIGATLFAPTTLGRAVAKLGFVQADPIRAPARAQDLILRHRVADYRAGDMGGLTVWQRTEQYLRAAAVSSNGHGPRLVLYVDPVAPEFAQ